MPSGGKNAKAVVNQKPLNQFAQHWCQFS